MAKEIKTQKHEDTFFRTAAIYENIDLNNICYILKLNATTYTLFDPTNICKTC